MIKPIILLTLLAAQTMGSACLAQAVEPVKVGCLYPLSGPGALYGRDSAVAIRLAVEHIESLAQAGNPQIDVLIEDSRSKSLRSIQIARRFVEDDQVDFLCGVVSSSVARSVSAVSREKEVFFIGTDHASPTLTSEDLHPYYFRLNNGSRQSMQAGARYISETYAQRSEPLKIAFIGPDYEYGYQAWDDLQRFLKADGVPFENVGEFWPRVFETDFAPYINELIRAKPDIVINGQWGLDLVTFVKQADQQQLFNTTQFMNFDAGGNYEILAELGNDMPLGLVLSARHHVNWPQTAQNQDFVDRFFERAGRYPSYAAEGAYAGILAIAEAVRQAGGTRDKNRVRVALENLELSLPEDPEGFKSRMDPATHQLLQVQAIGRTVFNNKYPPATVQLGEWSIYHPPSDWPQVQEMPTSE